MITESTIQKIKDYAKVEEVIGDYITIKRAGANYKACCPFHDEKSPSFMISPAKNIYKCFGCGKSGSPIDFVMEHDRLSYPEALKYLAQRYNIEIEETFNAKEQIEEKKQTDQLYEVLQFATTFFSSQLHDTQEGKAIGLSYFKKRGFLDKTIHQFSLGYAPEGGDIFYKEAIKKGFTAELIEKAGLIKLVNSRYIDFFRGRVIFPIFNIAGKPVAFGGRIMNTNDKQPKYINSPETEVYIKSKLVYGIYHAKTDIRKQDFCLLVEGYTDVVSLAQNGITNVVASSGTALTIEQLRLIKRFSSNLHIIYDGDSAGIKAALRGLDIALEEDLNVKVVLLPDGHDPDTYVQKFGGEVTAIEVKDKAQDFIFFMANLLFKEVENDPIKHSEATKQIIRSIAHISDNIKSAYYIKLCSQLANLPEDVVIKEFNTVKKNVLLKNKPQLKEELQHISNEEFQPLLDEKTPINDHFIQEKDLIRVLIEYGDKPIGEFEHVVSYIAHELGEGHFLHKVFQDIYDFYLLQFENGIDFEKLKEIDTYPKELQAQMIDIFTEQYAISPNWYKKHQIFIREKVANYIQDVKSALHRILLYRFLEHIKKIDISIKEAHQNKEQEKLLQLMAEKSKFHNEIKVLAKELGTVVMKY